MGSRDGYSRLPDSPADGGKICYEVKVTARSGKKEKKYELSFSEDGKLIEEEQITEEKRIDEK